jgi:hypothetical protein
MKKKVIPYIILTCLLTACSPQPSDMINGEDTVREIVIPTTASVSDNDEETTMEPSAEETEPDAEVESKAKSTTILTHVAGIIAIVLCLYFIVKFLKGIIIQNGKHF